MVPSHVCAPKEPMALATIVDHNHGNIKCKIFSFASLVADNDNTLRNKVLMMAALSDLNMFMYLEVMRLENRQEFISAMGKEWHDQLANGNFSIVTKDIVPEGATVVPVIWAFKHKQDIRTWRIKKNKTCLNTDRSNQVAGCNYDKTYAPFAQ